MITIKDVAEKSGVSIATVYKVFSNNYSTRPQIRQQVMDAADELGYTHKSLVQPSGASKAVGVVICDSIAGNGFYSYILRALGKELSRSGYQLISLFTEKDSLSEQEGIVVMSERKLDSLILTPVSPQPLEAVQKLIDSRFPILQMFQRVYPELDTILFDDVVGTKLAVRHLIKCGHTKIMLLTRHSRHDRVLGYRQAFEECGLIPDENMIRVLTYNQSVKEMIKGFIETQKPTAIISVSEGLTTCTLQALLEMKLSIPDDMSLISYDDFNWLTAVGISAVSHPFESFGALAAKMIVERIENPSSASQLPHQLVLDPVLIVRDSIRILR